MIVSSANCKKFKTEFERQGDYVTCITVWNESLTVGCKSGFIFNLDIETLEEDKTCLYPHETSSIKVLFSIPSSSTEKLKDLLVCSSFGGKVSLINSYCEVVTFLKPHKDVIWDMIKLPNELFETGDNKAHHILTCSSDKSMKIHKIDEPELKTIKTIETKQSVVSLCLSPKSTSTSTTYFDKKRFLFAADRNRDVNVYELETFKILYTFDSLHEGWINKMISYYLPKQKNDILDKRLVVGILSEKSSIYCHLINRLISPQEKKQPGKNRKKKGRSKKIRTLFRKIDNLHDISNQMTILRYLDYCDNEVDFHDTIYALSCGKNIHGSNLSGIMKKVNLSRSECVKQYSDIHRQKNIFTCFQIPSQPNVIVSSDSDGNIIKWTLEDDIKTLIHSERIEKISDNIFVRFPMQEVMVHENYTRRNISENVEALGNDEKDTNQAVDCINKRNDFKDGLIDLLRISNEGKRKIIKNTCSFSTIIKMMYQQVKKMNEALPSKNEEILASSRDKDIFVILKIRKTEKTYIAHKDVILYNSDFLFKMISFGGQETQDFEDQRMVMIEVADFQNNSFVMECFIEYMYLKRISRSNFGVLLNLFHFSNVYFENDLRDYMFEKIKKVSQRLAENLLFEMNLIEYGYLIENKKTLNSLFDYWETLNFMNIQDRINSAAFCDHPDDLLIDQKKIGKKEEELKSMSEKTQEEVRRRELLQLEKLKSMEERKKMIEEFDLRNELERLVEVSRKIHGSKMFEDDDEEECGEET